MSDPGRIAAIDFGTVRLGIALSDRGRRIASPLETYTRRTPELDAKRLKRLVTEDEVTLFVVGLPVHLDGNESRKSLEARAFGQWLGEVTGVPVEFFDERFTTSLAHQLLSDAQLRGRQRKERLDRLAAQILLTAYLEAGGQGNDRPGGLE